jgi:tetratricopeptide (TPR) repeat protein
MYESGDIEADIEKAVEWYEKAAEQGHADSQLALGYLYSTGEGVKKDMKTAKKWFESAAEQEDVDAMLELGKIYEAERDYSRAFEYYETPAYEGYTYAQFRLGTLYVEGKLGVPNITEGCFWIYLAANYGDFDSSYCDKNLTVEQRKTVQEKLEELEESVEEYDG